MEKKACGSYQKQLGRALSKLFGIKFPIRAKNQPGLDFPDNTGGWMVYDLSLWMPGSGHKIYRGPFLLGKN